MKLLIIILLLICAFLFVFLYNLIQGRRQKEGKNHEKMWRYKCRLKIMIYLLLFSAVIFFVIKTPVGAFAFFAEKVYDSYTQNNDHVFDPKEKKLRIKQSLMISGSMIIFARDFTLNYMKTEIRLLSIENILMNFWMGMNYSTIIIRIC